MAFLFLTLLTFGSMAQAQMQGMAWGSGMWGGQQACSTAQASAMMMPQMQQMQQQPQQQPMQPQQDEATKAAADDLKEAKAKLQAKKKEKQKLDKETDQAREDISNSIQSSYSDFILEHIENARSCDEYQENTLPSKTGRISKGSRPKTAPFTGEEWASYCMAGLGAVSSEVCSDFRSGGGGKSGTCAKALPIYRKSYQASQKAQDEIENLQRKVEQLTEDYKEAKKNATEGGVCVECMAKNNGYNPQSQAPGTNWGSVLTTVGMGLAGMYANYQSQKTMAQYNSNLGFATQPQPSLGYGYPFSLGGSYGGTMSGTGAGTFGCGSSMAGNSLYGNTGGYQMQMYQQQMYQQQLQQQAYQLQLAQYQTQLQYGVGQTYLPTSLSTYSGSGSITGGGVGVTGLTTTTGVMTGR